MKKILKKSSKNSKIEKLFKKHDLTIPDGLKNHDEASTVIYTYYDNNFMGTFSIKDTPKQDIARVIKALKNDKYDTWEWNWGASPRFERSVKLLSPGGSPMAHKGQCARWAFCG